MSKTVTKTMPKELALVKSNVMAGFKVRITAALTLAAMMSLCSAFAARADEIAVTQWGQSLYGMPFAIGMDKGYFKQAGIDITDVVGSAGGGTSVRNILALDTPYGEVSTAAAVAAARQGLDIVIVNSATHTVAESSLVTLPNSNIKELADLAGQKVAITSPRSSSELIFLMELTKAGIDRAKVQIVASGGYTQSLTLLDQGAVSAAALIEPLSIVRKDRYRTVVRAKDLLQPMTTSVGITTRAFAKEHPEKLKAIISGRRVAVRFIYANPTEAATLISKRFNQDPALAKIGVQNMVEANMWTEGGFDMQELDRIAEGLLLVGELQTKPDWDTLIDRSFLPPDIAN